MQNGPYIAERLMPKIIAEYCEQANIEFQSFSHEWVLRLTKGDITRWVVGYTFDVNRAAAGELARDKVAAYDALQAAGVAAAPHYLVRSLPKELIHDQELHQRLHATPVVAKPLDGTGGRDVHHFSTVDEALTMIRKSGEPAWALSPYFELQAEYRFIMLDNELLLAYEKTQPTSRGQLKLFNLGYGAVAKDISEALMQKLLPAARQVMRAMALRLAAVDMVKLADGTYIVLEVNGGITMEHYARQSDVNKSRASDVYSKIVKALLH